MPVFPSFTAVVVLLLCACFQATMSLKDLIMHHGRSLAVPSQVKYGQVHSALLDIYGPEMFAESMCIPGTSVTIQGNGTDPIVEEQVICSLGEDKETTLSGRSLGLGVDLASLKECGPKGFTGIPSCTKIVFEERGTMATSCSAYYSGGTCESCEVCVPDNVTLGVNISCVGVSDLSTNGTCLANSILEKAKRKGSYSMSLDFEQISSTLEEWFSFSCEYFVSRSETTNAFHVAEEIRCSGFHQNITSGMTKGSAQDTVDVPTTRATRVFRACTNDDFCAILFFDNAGTVVDACSAFVSSDACDSCEVCTAPNGDIGIDVSCSSHPEASTTGCKNFPILNPTETDPQTNPPTSAPTYVSSGNSTSRVLVVITPVAPLFLFILSSKC